MITTEYLRSKGFEEEEKGYELVYNRGVISISITTVENDPPFYYKIQNKILGHLPDDKVFLAKLLKYYG